MNQNTVTGDYININLRQLGATSIKEFNSIMHIAEFDLGDGLIVSYVFNITRHNKYFLQRMQPYAMVHGKFASDQEIIDFITADLKRFENAKNSHNFNTFLLISHLGHHITENIEQLFLNYNVLCAHPFRITRNADLAIDEDEAEDLLLEIEKQIKKRTWGQKINIYKNCP